MSLQEQIAELRQVVDTIFTSKQYNTDITACVVTTSVGTFPGRTFVSDTLRGFDFIVKQNGQNIPLRVIEQNPNKRDPYMNLSQYAVLAQKGHKIAWVIRRDTDTFIGKIMDGQFEKIKPKATTTAKFSGNETYQTQKVQAEDQFNQNYDQFDNGSFVSDLPEICAEDVIGIVGG